MTGSETPGQRVNRGCFLLQLLNLLLHAVWEHEIIAAGPNLGKGEVESLCAKVYGPRSAARSAGRAHGFWKGWRPCNGSGGRRRG